ncbi:MAG TPA: TlpA disulfide reductase family protein [Pyrinomonadaceae bacterium]|jgi:thiol-disulfide isomerase/thioredoxin
MSLQSEMVRSLARVHELRRGIEGLPAALSELESAMDRARAAPYEVEFRTRIELVLSLAEAYLSTGAQDRARLLLDEEVAFAEKIFELVQSAGTPEQKRAAAAGRTQLRDRSRHLSLIGHQAPEICVDTWLSGEPATLESLRGRVVLLEFWATWCKPCREMFGKLRRLDEEYGARGLDVLALTRYYYAARGEASTQEQELELMRRMVLEHGIKFRVGVAPDEATQELYGANGLPTLALVDRVGVVRYAHFGGGEDARFEELLRRSLEA